MLDETFLITGDAKDAQRPEHDERPGRKGTGRQAGLRLRSEPRPPAWVARGYASLHSIALERGSQEPTVFGGTHSTICDRAVIGQIGSDHGPVVKQQSAAQPMYTSDAAGAAMVTGSS